MEVTRKIFYNKRNGQASITLPAKELKKFEEGLKLKKPLETISISLHSPHGLKDSKLKLR
jgi:hypothetical protein